MGRSGVDGGVPMMDTLVDRSVVDGGVFSGGSGGCVDYDDGVLTAVAAAVAVTAGDGGNKTAKAPRPLAVARRHIGAVARIGTDESPPAICKQMTKQARASEPLSFHPLSFLPVLAQR